MLLYCIVKLQNLQLTLPSLLVTESYSQEEIDIEKYSKLSSKLPGVKEQRLKPFPWLF